MSVKNPMPLRRSNRGFKPLDELMKKASEIIKEKEAQKEKSTESQIDFNYNSGSILQRIDKYITMNQHETLSYVELFNQVSKSHLI